MEFVKKKCKGCGEIRKFRVGAANDKHSLCGECFEWERKW